MNNAPRVAAAALATCALVLALMGGQAVSDATSPSGYADTGALLGRTGFAYVTVLRTFAAAALWNRLDPQFHEYYGGSLSRAAFAIPTMRAVTWLDPQMVEAYYTGPWIIRELGSADTAFEFAREGVENNPRAGILWAQLAQLEFIEGHIEEAYAYARRGLGDVYWRSDSDRFEGYGIMRAVFERVGDKERERVAATVLSEIREELGAEGAPNTEPEAHDE